MIRASLRGAAIGGAVFLLLGVYLNRMTGAGPFEHPAPLAVLVVIGATVAGLVAPLFRRARARSAGAPRGTEPASGPEPSDGED